MSRLRIVPLDDVVVFPGMTVTLQLEDVGGETRVLLVPRQGQGFARVGVVAEVSHRSGCPTAAQLFRSSDFTAAFQARRRLITRASSASRSTNGPIRWPPLIFRVRSSASIGQ